jgi:hypothetical protein
MAVGVWYLYGEELNKRVKRARGRNHSFGLGVLGHELTLPIINLSTPDRVRVELLITGVITSMRLPFAFFDVNE